MGPVRDSNPGPLAPEARIIPLDQQANVLKAAILVVFILIDGTGGGDKKKSADKSTVQPSTVLADITNIKCKIVFRLDLSFRVLLQMSLILVMSVGLQLIMKVSKCFANITYYQPTDSSL